MTRVFILSHHRMFGHGLESLLSKETNLELVGQATDEQQAIEQIRKLHPNVVIWDSKNDREEPGPALLHVLKENPGIKLVNLSLHHNNAYVYQVTEWAVDDLAELVEMIKVSPRTGSKHQVK